MEKTEVPNAIISTQTVLCTDIFAQPQRLTPTGKISHAKTRVYTQRYRKEWEEMPDFKGWLTSVPYQPTRALCVYCKKNLHAHRLSLLKHTCTMKHQRAALMHHNENNGVKTKQENKGVYPTHDFEQVDMDSLDKTGGEDEENESYEYVVERLEMEDDENDEAGQDNDMLDEESDNIDARAGSDEEDGEKLAKKVKIEHIEQPDTLAQAMAHVHGDYSDGIEDQSNVDMEMVDPTITNETAILPEPTDDDYISKDEQDSDKSGDSEKPDQPIATETPESSDPASKKTFVAYHLNGSQLEQIKNSGTSSTPSKTLTVGGKTVTLSSGKILTGGQFVLSKVKGNLPALLMAGSKAPQPRTIAPKAGTSTPKNIPTPGPSKEIQKKNTTNNNANKPSLISTHVIDTTKGLPVGGLQVSLYKLMDGRWTFLNESTTTPNGRCADLVDSAKCPVTAGRYKMHFDIDKYFTLRRIETMYPFIEIVFDIKNPTGNHHVPLLLSPFGFSTYRGSDR